MYTSNNRLTGLFSGYDTQSMITSMMKTETMKLQRMQRNLISTNWKQEIYRGVYTDLSGFQKKFLDLTSSSSINYSTTFKAQAVSVKTSAGQDSNAVTVGAGAKDGNYSVKIEQLAAADLYQSASKIGGDIKSANGFMFEAGNIREGTSYEITLDGASRKISFKEGDIVSGGTLTFKDGIISIKNTDETVAPLDEHQFIDVFNQKLKNSFGTEGTGSKQKIEAKLTEGSGISIFTNGHHTGFSIADGGYLLSSSTAAKTPETAARRLELDIIINGSEVTLSAETEEAMTPQELAASLNGALSEKGLDGTLQFGIDGETGAIKLTSGLLTGNIELRDGENGDGSLAYLGFDDGAVKLNGISSLAGIGITSGSASKFSADRSLSDIFGSGLTSETSFTIGDKTFLFTGETQLSDLMNQVNNSGLNVTLSYDAVNEVFQLESSKTGCVNKIELSGEFLTKNLGFGTEAIRTAADSVATINGVTLTRPTNNYEFAGTNWTLNRTTGDDELTVTVSRDADKVVDAIKGFVDGYNALVDKLRGLTNTARPKSANKEYYDPLLDEEMAEMSERQISMWEEKAKTGLLYRDAILTGIASQLRTAVYQPVKMQDGSSISLYSIGITTGNAWEQGGALSYDGKLVIDEDKLRKAIEESGDDVMTLFTKFSDSADTKTRYTEQGIAGKVNDIINSAVRPNGSIADKAGIMGYRSENDNVLSKQMKGQSDAIDLMYKKLAAKETYYYNLFARMEVNLAKANSQLQSLLSITGGSSQ